MFSRMWRRNPGLAIVAIVTLAIGIGSSATLYGIVHAVLIRPLPYADPDRLVLVRAEQDFDGARRPVPVSFQSDAVAQWPASGTAIERIAFYAENVGALAGDLGADLVSVTVVSGPFFETVGGDIALGRALTRDDEAAPVAVISTRLWRQRFGASDEVLGRVVTLNGQQLTVVGVAAESFQVPGPSHDVWMTAGAARLRLPSCCGFTPIARLRPGATVRGAGDEVGGVVAALAHEMPRTLGGVRAHVVDLHEALVGTTRPVARLLAVAVGLILLLACANVLNLLLARNAARAHETAVRRALGASRTRLLAESLAESAALSLLGSAVGMAGAVACVRALRAWPPAGLPRVDGIHVDGSVVAFTFVVAVLTTLLVGLAPAVQAGDVQATLAGQERGRAGGRQARRVLRSIIVAQLAMALVLLVGASLLGRSLVALMQTDIGITSSPVATASINLAMDRTLTDAQQVDLVARIVTRMSAMPDVASAGVGAARPPDTSRMRLTLKRSDDPDARASYQAAGVPATPGYFTALGIRLERGRFFSEADVVSAPPVVILSRDAAHRLFGDEDPIGRTIGLPVLRDGRSGGEDMTVVGIVSSVRYSGLDQAADDVVYRPFAQQPWRSVFVVVRSTGDAEALAGRLRREIAAVDPAITIGQVATMDTVLETVTASPRLRSRVLAAFAIVATLIAGVGLYGVVAYSVSQRRQEIGVRMALGAGRDRIWTMVVREGLVLGLLGGALGIASAWGGARLLATFLYGTAPTDPLSFALSTVAVVAVAVTASLVPAVRASRTDPLITLRAE